MLRARLRVLQVRLAPAGSRRHKYLRSAWRRLRSGAFWGPPRLTLLLPIDQADRASIDATIASVIAQRDWRWQLILVGDGADEIAAARPHEERIVAWTSAGDPVDRLNAAGAAAGATFVAAIGAGDVLLPHALRSFSRSAVTRAASAGVVYGDEIDASKPDWSPDLLLAFPYTGRICAFRHGLIARLGGWTAATFAAGDYRLVLAAARAGVPVRRLGEI